MQTNLDPRFQNTHEGEVVESILRKCVHCGFCNATCPTYQLRGDELDGPRGRIYQMKQFFEGAAPNTNMLLHLDRCLTCRSCETTCPSGVKYGQLLEVGRDAIAEELPRSWWDRWRRKLIVHFIGSGPLFLLSIRIGQILAPILPGRLRASVPARQQPVSRIRHSRDRKVLMLEGCSQPALTPNTNACAVNLLDRLGIEVIETNKPHCCGAVGLHTSEPEVGLQRARDLIDLWWPHIETGAEAIVVNASGCGVTIKDFGRMLQQDPDYADKAQRISNLSRDLVEMLEPEMVDQAQQSAKSTRVAVHTPCSLQHGLGINHRIEAILMRAGYQICRVHDAHLCCGSAGTYSILQSEISGQLRENKIAALTVDAPDIIVTANVGCQLQLAQGNSVPVKHWVELL
ncbi:MAG: glycolate oxidase subunit GlcF [Pseudomonadota bacterium]